MRADIRYIYRPALVVAHRTSRLLDSVLGYIGEIGILLGQTLRYLPTPPDPSDAMTSIGVYSLPIALLTITFSGMVLALYTASEMVKQGLSQYVGGLIGLSMSRELAPVLAAIVVAARSGSGIAAELGTMTVTEQVDALRSLATSPVQFLVVPRFIACVAMLPMLTLFGEVVGTIGAYLVARTVGVPWQSFTDSIKTYVTQGDIVTGMAKTLVFGVIIAMVACHQGLTASGGASGVGRATTRSVVLCIIFIYLADFIIVRLLVPGQ